MKNAFVRKLEGFRPLSGEDSDSLAALTATAREIDADADIAREGGEADGVHFVLEGLASRYKLRSDGGRQILAFLVAGDFCGMDYDLLGYMDHAVGTLARSRIATVPQAAVRELAGLSEAIRAAFRWSTLVDEAIAREWMVGLGQRPADRRIAHLFCELHVRIGAVGLAMADGFRFPVTQQELGDATGLSTVHVNRSLKVIREEGLAVFRGGMVGIPDVSRLRSFADFDPGYLHLVVNPANGKSWQVMPTRTVRGSSDEGASA